MKVLYIDLGVHDGQEIDDMYRLCSENDIQVDIKGIEANPNLFKKLKNKYTKHGNVEIYNFCVGETNGTVSFYLADNPISSSMYGDKINLGNKQKINVPMQPLSDFIKNIENFNDYDITIMKANIEGAEYDMLKDLDANDSFVFDIYLGSGASPYSFLKDMTKIPSLVDSIEDAESIMNRRNIIAYRFIGNHRTKDPKKVNIDIIKQIKETHHLKKSK